MTEFLRDPRTGYVYAYKDGKLVGPMQSMGDGNKVPDKPSTDLWKLKYKREKSE